MNIFEELKKAPKVDINEVSYGRGKKIHPDSACEKVRMKALQRGKIVDGKNMREWAEHYGIHETAMRRFYRMNGHVRYTRKNAQSRLAKQKRKQIEKYYTRWRAEVDQNVRMCNRMYSAQKISILLGFEKGCVNYWLTKIHKETLVLAGKRKLVDGKIFPEWAEHYGTTGRVAKKIEGKTIPEWAEHYGLSGPAIRRRIHRNGHPHPRKWG